MRNMTRITVATVLPCVLLVGNFSCGMLESGAPQKAGTQFALAKQERNASSFFTLDFGEFGGEQVAQISRTDFVLEFNADEGTARFASYYQVIDPIVLPGGVSTGKITVVIQNSLGGTFDAETGEFRTDDVYAIYFDGDLGAFGIESPFILPSTSQGTLTFDADTGQRGRVNMIWAGGGTLAEIPFSYTCRVRAAFEAPFLDELLSDVFLEPR